MSVPTTIAALGAPFAHGATADIYALGDGSVVKLFRASVPRSAVEAEVVKTRAAKAAGLPVAATGEVFVIEDRVALSMERVAGPTLTSQAVAGRVTPEAAGRVLAELHAAVHADAGMEPARVLPSKKEWLGRVLSRFDVLADDRRAALRALLDELPDGGALCHGDLHPDNVLLPSDGGPRLIDWSGATRGPALADVGETVLLLTAVHVPDHVPGRAVIEGLKHAVNDAYLRRYFELMPGSRQEVERWLPLNAAARLSYRIEAEREALLAVVNGALA